MEAARTAPPDRVQGIDALLPQTQCTRCGEPDCASYARAIAAGAAINRCPPGGVAGVQRLAALTGRPALPLDPAHGQEGPRHRVWIDEALCIGCTLCIKACPVDAIVGAAKRMHDVLDADCTGCELCIPACPVDCIRLEVATPGRSGWAAWSSAQAEQARTRYLRRQARLAREQAHEARRLAARSARSKPTPAPWPISGDPACGPPAAARPESGERTATADATAPGSAAEAQKQARISAALERARALRAT